MKQPLLVVVAIIIEADNVLLVKRVREPFQGYWALSAALADLNILPIRKK